MRSDSDSEVAPGAEGKRFRHISVMPGEVKRYLNCRPGGTYVDGTLGGCGHAHKICEAMQPGGTLIGIDQDRDAIAHAKRALSIYERQVRLFNDNFANLAAILSGLNIEAVDGVVLDLGLSQNQLVQSGRGFSFRKDEPLDMRMDVQRAKTAAAIVNEADVRRLIDIFRSYGEERRARMIARRIVAERKKEPINTSGRLAQLICAAVGPKAQRIERIHPATRVFQALRIAVNRELDVLANFMSDAADYLNPGARLCVISFHSLEDRIVKRQMRSMAQGCICPPDFPRCTCGRKPSVHLVTKKVLRPKQAELAQNPMARSARMRVCEKLAEGEVAV